MAAHDESPPRVLRRTWGWWPIWGYVIAHNVFAAATRREYLSQAAARHRRRHPVLVPVLGLVLFSHLMDWLGSFDLIDRAGDLLSRAVARP